MESKNLEHGIPDALGENLTEARGNGSSKPMGLNSGQEHEPSIFVVHVFIVFVVRVEDIGSIDFHRDHTAMISPLLKAFFSLQSEHGFREVNPLWRINRLTQRYVELEYC